LGAIAGSGLTAGLAGVLGLLPLLLVSAALLEGATWCAGWLARRRGMRVRAPDAGMREEAQAEGLRGGGTWGGLIGVARSPYLAAICLYVLVLTVGSTFLYFEQARIVSEAFESREARARAFATIDVLAQTLTALLQAFVAGRLIRKIGVGWALALLPLVTIAGFGALMFAPTLVVIVAVQTLRRATNHAIARPARETLFTVVRREDKYKAKNVIDTFVYRGGDALSAGVYKAMQSLSGAALWTGGATIALSVAWVGLSLWLGKRSSAGASAR
ncbi:MAG: MFS transporter, partial [Phycisphaerales bacterium]